MERDFEGRRGRRGNLFRIMAMVACAIFIAVTPLRVEAGEAPQSKGESYRKLSPGELKAMLARKDFLFVNVHVPYEGEIERTDGFIAFDMMEQQLHLLPVEKDAKIVLYCRSGHMSGIAADTLVRLGYTNVSHLEGGMVAWRWAGYPLKNTPPAR